MSKRRQQNLICFYVMFYRNFLSLNVSENWRTRKKSTQRKASLCCRRKCRPFGRLTPAAQTKGGVVARWVVRSAP